MRPTGLAIARPGELRLKRALDVAVATTLLVLLAPLMVVVALLVRLTSPGPALYVQDRVGKGGEHFRIWKFRSMVVDAHERLDELADDNEVSGPVFKMEQDPRVTRVGRVIRRLSLDELPQLFNVVEGSMSLVGPRPPLPHEVATYSAHQYQRLSVAPGLTCIWQVSGRSEIGFDQWVEMDLEYIRTWSLGLDLAILARTLPAVVSGDGAK